MNLLEAGAGANEGLDRFLHQMLLEEQERRAAATQQETGRHNLAQEQYQQDSLASLDRDRNERAANAAQKVSDDAEIRSDTLATRRVALRPVGAAVPDNEFEDETKNHGIPSGLYSGWQPGNMGQSTPEGEVGPTETGRLWKGTQDQLTARTRAENTGRHGDDKGVVEDTTDGLVRTFADGTTEPVTMNGKTLKKFHQTPGTGTVIYPGPNGPLVVDKGSATSRPVTSPGGDGNLPLAPTTQDRNLSSAAKRVQPMLDAINELSPVINTKPGMQAIFAGGWRSIMARAKEDDDVAEYVAVVEAFTPLLARAEGHTGVLTEADVEHASKILPTPMDSASLAQRKMVRLQKVLGTISSGAAPKTPQQPEGAPQVGGTFNGSKVLKVEPYVPPRQ